MGNMIYRRLQPLRGKIFIDGANHMFEIVGLPHAGYVEITAFYKGVAVSGHKIPIDAKLFQAFYTGGHQYKVTRQQTVI